MGFADGLVQLYNAQIDPFAPGAPIRAERVDGTAIAFSAMMRDLGVTPDTIVSWDLKKTRVTKVNGTLDPLKIDAELSAETRDFEVFDRAYHDSRRRHMIGVRGNAAVRGRDRRAPGRASRSYDTRADFGKSSVHTRLVSIGFHNDIALKVAKGSVIQLEDATPLIDIPWKGRAEIELEMKGKANDPVILGTLSRPEPRVRRVSAGRHQKQQGALPTAQGRLYGRARQKGQERLRRELCAPRLRHDGLVDRRRRNEERALRSARLLGDVAFRRGPALRTHCTAMPRSTARIHYDLGGQLDRCGGGFLRVDGSVKTSKLDLFDERYDSGDADFDFRWADRDASYLGFEVDIPSLTLRKGSGTLLGSLERAARRPARGHVVGTSLAAVQARLARPARTAACDGRVSAVAEVSGSSMRSQLDTSVRVTPVRVGSSTLPAFGFPGRARADPQGAEVDRQDTLRASDTDGVRARRNRSATKRKEFSTLAGAAVRRSGRA